MLGAIAIWSVNASRQAEGGEGAGVACSVVASGGSAPGGFGWLAFPASDDDGLAGSGRAAGADGGFSAAPFFGAFSAVLCGGGAGASAGRGLGNGTDFVSRSTRR